MFGMFCRVCWLCKLAVDPRTQNTIHDPVGGLGFRVVSLRHNFQEPCKPLGSGVVL